MKATTYIVSGAGGSNEGRPTFKYHKNTKHKISDYRNNKTFSYTRFYVYNKTTIYLEQVFINPSKGNDSAWYVQEYHPFHKKNKNKKNNKTQKILIITF